MEVPCLSAEVLQRKWVCSGWLGQVLTASRLQGPSVALIFIFYDNVYTVGVLVCSQQEFHYVNVGTARRLPPYRRRSESVDRNRERERGLLLIRLPKNYHVSWVFTVFQPNSRFYKNPNPNPNHNREAIHNPNQNPNPSPKQSNCCITSLSRDQNSCLPITLQGSIFTLSHGGDSESASKNKLNSSTFIPSGPFHKNFLKIWASDLVGAERERDSDRE